MKFSRYKCKVLTFQLTNVLAMQRLGLIWLGSSFAGKALELQSERSSHAAIACPSNEKCQLHPKCMNKNNQQIEGNNYSLLLSLRDSSSALGRKERASNREAQYNWIIYNRLSNDYVAELFFRCGNYCSSSVFMVAV